MVFIIFLNQFLNHYPDYLGFKNTPKDKWYTGQVSWFDPWDINNYFAVINQVQAKRELLCENFNTTDADHKKTFIYPLYIIVGNLFPHINNIILFHGTAIIFGIILCCSIFVLCLVLLEDVNYALVALFLISLGGGLGWLFSSMGQSADINIPWITFMISFQKPHQAIAAILYLSSLVCYFFSLQKNNIILNLCSLIFILLLIPFSPYHLLSYALICGLYTFIEYHRKKHFKLIKQLSLNFLIIFISGSLYFWHFLHSDFSVLSSYKPPYISLLSLILGYGFFLPVYLFQLVFSNPRNEKRLFLNIFIIISICLFFTPGMGRLFLNNLLFPIIIVILLWLKKMSTYSQNNKLNVYLIILFLLISTSLSSFYIFNQRIKALKSDNHWIYLPLEIKTGLEFLNNKESAGVIALPLMASYIPAHTHHRIYFGLQHQTPNYEQRLSNSIIFFENKMDNNQGKVFLNKNNISYVFFGPEEKDLAKSNSLYYNFLENIYQNEKVIIYKIK